MDGLLSETDEDVGDDENLEETDPEYEENVRKLSKVQKDIKMMPLYIQGVHVLLCPGYNTTAVSIKWRKLTIADRLWRQQEEDESDAKDVKLVAYFVYVLNFCVFMFHGLLDVQVDTSCYSTKARIGSLFRNPKACLLKQLAWLNFAVFLL